MEEDSGSYANSDSTTLVSSSPDHSNHPSNHHSMMSNGHADDVTMEPTKKELHLNMSGLHDLKNRNNDVGLTPNDPHDMFGKKSPIIFAIHDETNLNQCKLTDKNKFKTEFEHEHEQATNQDDSLPSYASNDNHKYVNGDRHMQSYESSQNLTGVGTPKSNRHENVGGIDNPAFYNDEGRGSKRANGKDRSDDYERMMVESNEGHGMNGGANTTITMGLTSPNKAHQNETKVPEAVNLELVNMAPISSGKTNGQVGIDNNGGLAPGATALNSIPVKKDTEVDLSVPYDEYFVPVNEHRKYMRCVQALFVI